MIFVFGSNLAGIHGAGAAKVAKLKYGAVVGVGFGRTGNAYAIPTKDRKIETVSKDVIRHYVDGFKQYAKENKELVFQVTRIGCGLAGYKDAEIAPMFRGSPDNCQFDEAWGVCLGDSYLYWGHVS